MAKNHVLPRYLFWVALCVCLLPLCGFLITGGRGSVDGDRRNDHPLRGIYQSEIGVREATGNNDGSKVEEYLRYCGLGKGYAWCAAFVSWCHGQAGYAEPRNAWSPALFPSSRTIWRAGDRWPATGGQPIPRAGDVFGIYYTNLQRIAHVGFVDEWDGNYCTTVEGNTGPPTDEAVIDDDPANPIRAGPPIDGVYRKRRPIRTIHTVARWTESEPVRL